MITKMRQRFNLNKFTCSWGRKYGVIHPNRSVFGIPVQYDVSTYFVRINTVSLSYKLKPKNLEQHQRTNKSKGSKDESNIQVKWDTSSTWDFTTTGVGSRGQSISNDTIIRGGSGDPAV